MRPLTVNVINEEEAGTQRRNREIVGFERRGEDGQGGGAVSWAESWRGMGPGSERWGERMEAAGKCERLGRLPTRARTRVALFLC